MELQKSFLYYNNKSIKTTAPSMTEWAQKKATPKNRGRANKLKLINYYGIKLLPSFPVES